MEQEVHTIEKEAHDLLNAGKYHEAAELFYQGANSYKKIGKHHEAAMCLASAASCWALKAGEQTFYNAARDYEKAAKEAQKTGDWEYTALLYKHAAVCYDRDKEYINFADCYFQSKECYLKFIGKNILDPWRYKSVKRYWHEFMQWLVLWLSSLMWGHGERPFRTVIFSAVFIFLTGVVYMAGFFIKEGQLVHPNLGEGIYFSTATFLTVSYGDLIPVGFNRGIAILESFGGLFIFPIFITGLCRKYLRE